MRVIIVGAGIGGLSTAIALDRIGIDSIVLEKAPALSAEGAAITVWNNALQALSRLRLRSDYRRVIEPFHVLHVFSSRGQPLNDVPVSRLANEFGPGGAMVYRPELAALLADSLRPEQLQFGAEVVDVEEDADGITAVLADGGRVRGDLLVGADGGRGATKRLFASPDLVYCRHVAWRGTAQFEHSFFSPGESFSIVGQGAYVVVHHLTNGRFYWIGTRRADEPRHLEPERKKAEAREWFSAWPEPVQALVEATPESSIIVNDIFACSQPDYAVRRRVVLVGDAAHLSAPQLGQGAAMALEDAVVLAACLRDEAWPAAGRRFAALRQARATRVADKSRGIANAYHRNTPAQVWMRNAVIKASPPFAMLKRAAWAATTELPTLNGHRPASVSEAPR